jgi:hypothetical protein
LRDVARRSLARSWIGAAALLGLPAAAPALADATPLALSNQAVLARVHGVPVAQPARLLAPAQSQWLLTSTLANTFSKDASGNEAIFLDGETEELRLQWRHGFAWSGHGFELFAALPWVHHGGGFLDHAIIEFHKLFGMPQGNRTRFRNDQLRYAYLEGDRMLLEFEHSESGIGDLQLGIGGVLSQSDAHALSARFYVKLPTGDADRLTGNDATDVSAALHYARALWGGDFDAAIGVVALGDGEVLKSKQRDAAAFGHAAWAYPWSAALDVVVQLGANSGFYHNTDLTELGDALYLGVGTRYRLTPRYAVEFSVIEDILVDSAPDVVFQLALRYTTN